MKRPLLIIGFLVYFIPGQNPVLAADTVSLETVARSLPPRYLADVPEANRERLWKMLVGLPAYNNPHLDEKGGWIHWYSDGPPGDSPGGTSMFWVKLLPVPNGNPLVFVHMSKPFSNGSEPDRNQTFVLQQNGRGWKDVTDQTIPREVHLTLHFRPRRSDYVIEVAEYEKFQRNDGQGTAIRFGRRKQDLIWENGKFQVRKPDGTKLSSADGNKSPP